MQTTFGNIVVLLGAFGVLRLAFIISRACIYDIRDTKRRRDFQRTRHARRYRHRPLISLVIITHNDAGTIDSCLQSICGGSYRKFEVIIVDRASDDRTRERVVAFQKRHPKRAIKLLSRRQTGTELASIQAGLKKCAPQAELIGRLRVSDRLDREALARVVRRFQTDHHANAVVFNQRLSMPASIGGLVQAYLDVVSTVVQKARSETRSARLLIDSSVLYRKAAYRRAIRQAQAQLPFRMQVSLIGAIKSGSSTIETQAAFAGDAVVRRAPVQSLFQLCAQVMRRRALHQYVWRQQTFAQLHQARIRNRLPGFGRLCLGLLSSVSSVLLVVLLTYFTYLALVLHETALLLICCLAVGLLLSLAIWSDEVLSGRQKVRYCLGLPATYGVLYILALVRVFAPGYGLLLRR